MASKGHSAPERPGLGCFPLPSASQRSGGLYIDSPSLGALSTAQASLLLQGGCPLVTPPRRPLCSLVPGHILPAACLLLTLLFLSLKT